MTELYQESHLMSVSDAVASRSSCRDFLPKEVSLDLMMKILDESRRAPSSGNMQPWRIYLIHGENKTKLTNIIKTKIDDGVLIDLPLGFTIYPGLPPVPISSIFKRKFKEKFPIFYQRHAEMGKMVYSAQGVKRGDTKMKMEKVFRAFDFFGAPVGLIFTIDKRMGYGQYPDLGILLQSTMLLCQQYGLSTCSIVAWSLHHETLKKVLNIKQNEKIFCGMAVGYKNDKSPVNQFKSQRMTLDEMHMVVVPQINENIKVESAYVFKAKVALCTVQYYCSEIMMEYPYLVLIITCFVMIMYCLLR